ncbi:hypothetical protein CMV37_14285 [Bacillus cereus]|nr:hypothetical protein CMV37_14285 [Bacillus cereus]
MKYPIATAAIAIKTNTTRLIFKSFFPFYRIPLPINLIYKSPNVIIHLFILLHYIKQTVYVL